MKAKKPLSNGRRSQFNIQASGFSEKAYLYIEALSTKKALSQKIWEWAEREVNGEYSPSNTTPSVESNTQHLEQQVQLLQKQLSMFMNQVQQGMSPMGGYPPMQYQQHVPYPLMPQVGATQQQQPMTHQGQQQPSVYQQPMNQQPMYQQQPMNQQPMYQQQPMNHQQPVTQQPTVPTPAPYAPPRVQKQNGVRNTKQDSMITSVSKAVVSSQIDEDTDYDF